jgi:hypothetical protein
VLLWVLSSMAKSCTILLCSAPSYLEHESYVCAVYPHCIRHLVTILVIRLTMSWHLTKALFYLIALNYKNDDADNSIVAYCYNFSILFFVIAIWSFRHALGFLEWPIVSQIRGGDCYIWVYIRKTLRITPIIKLMCNYY